MLAAFFCLQAPGVRAETPPVPPNLQVAILARMLAYDRAFKGRAGSTVGIGIVFKASDKGSAQAQADMLKAFKAMDPPTVHGLPVALSVHPYKDAAELAAWIETNGIDALYVTPGLAAELGAIGSACAAGKVVSMSGVRSFVEKAVAVGVTVKGENPKILVNLKIAESLGMELDAKLLQLSEVLR